MQGRGRWSWLGVIAGVLSVWPWGPMAAAQSIAKSDKTEECLACHLEATPGIVADWERSRHSLTTPREAKMIKGLALKVSAPQIPVELADTAVGCAECHTANPEKHADSFEHNGQQVHTVVTPTDCAVCHTQEVEQYRLNLMSFAYGNLMNNPLYLDLMKSINGVQTLVQGRLEGGDDNDLTRADSCLACHGTKVEPIGLKERETAFGRMALPRLKGWPNQGVGRENPDGSKGSCTACHTRHQFSMEMARKPATCGQCHSGPDVPAHKVYKVSKHGNQYDSLGSDWNFQSVPWVAGRDFNAPTCAVCHVSLVTGPEGSVLARRSHQMTDRLPWRIFGLIYAHPQPRDADTSGLKNSAGQPLPVDFDGNRAPGLIDADEMSRRRSTMQSICLGCHSSQWVEGHWARFEQAIGNADAMTRSATQIMQQIWTQKLVHGPAQQASPFDDAVEKLWMEQWLFFANTVRYSSAMMGADYGVFDNGRWQLSKNVRVLEEWLELHRHRKSAR